MKFEKQKILTKLNLFAACAVAFSFPFGRDITTPLLVIWFISETFLIKKPQIIGYKFSRSDIPYFFLIAYFTLYLLRIPCSNDLDGLFFHIEKKLSFIIIPLLFLLNKSKKRDLTLVFQFFVLGCLVMVFMSLSIAVYHSTSVVDGHLVFNSIIGEKANRLGYSFLKSSTQGGNYFFSTYISPFLHTTYYSIYLCFASVIVLVYTKWRQFSKKIILPFSLLAVFTLTVFFLSSRAGILTILFIIAVFLIYQSIKRNKWWSYTLVVLSCFAFFSFLIQSPRFDFMLKKYGDLEFTIGKNPTESLDLRIAVWHSSIDLMKKKWVLGYGPENVTEKLSESYEEKGYLYAEKKRLNAHNQYLQDLLGFGIIGIALLLSFITTPIFLTKNSTKKLMLGLLTIMFLNNLFETTFGVFSGIVFFSFFYCIIIKQEEWLISTR